MALGITRVILAAMKTAISIPDDIYEQAERYARKARLSRSELFARALEEYLEARSRESVTAKLNEIYARESSTLDPVVERAQAEALGQEDW